MSENFGMSRRNDDRQRHRSRSRERDRSARLSDRDHGRDHGRDTRDREWDRSRDRERDETHGRDGGRERNLPRRDQRSTREENVPSKTVMIKGLPSHTTEPSLYAVLAAFSPQEIRLISQRDTGDCKGFAFVEFYSVEHAQYFVASFAGSAGDPNAPQFIVENRAVLLEYARENTGPGAGGGSRDDGRPRRDDDKRSGIKSDWICEGCSCQNFARRQECYRCSAPKTDSCLLVSTAAGPVSETFSDSTTILLIAALNLFAYKQAVSSTTPSEYLVVRGLGMFTSEDQIMELFRQFAVVKSVFIVRDWATGASRGLAFLEFHSVEHASFAMQSSEACKLQLDRGQPLKVSFARQSFLAAQIAQSQQPPPMHHPMGIGAPNPMAAAALQAAQWSAATPAAGYGMLPGQSRPPIPGMPHPQAVPVGGVAPAAVAGLLGARGKPAWPPCFDTQGSAFVFQPQTGCFFEPASEYYYCPRSKLYYNSEDGVYFHYNPTADPPFTRFDPPVPLETDAGAAGGTFSSDATSSQSATAAAAAAAAAALARKPVIISLGGFGGAKSKKGSAAATGPNKKVLSDLAKWSSVNEAEDEPTEAAAAAASSTAVTSSATTAVSAGPVIPAITAAPAIPAAIAAASAPVQFARAQILSSSVTSSLETHGAPSSVPSAPASTVCLICRRQFNTPEQLLRHERESKLHAENVQKQREEAAAAAAATATSPRSQAEAGTANSTMGENGQDKDAGGYRDRASERRAGRVAEPASLRVLAAEGGGRARDSGDYGGKGKKHGDDESSRERGRDRGDESFGRDRVSGSWGRDERRGDWDRETGRERDRERERGRDREWDKERGSYSSGSGSSCAGYETGEPPQTLVTDEANPGNQLMRKMGWAEGHGLGKDGSGIQNPVEAVTRGDKYAGVGANDASIPPLVYGDGREYKDSLLRAARARYDQLSNS